MFTFSLIHVSQSTLTFSFTFSANPSFTADSWGNELKLQEVKKSDSSEEYDYNYDDEDWDDDDDDDEKDKDKKDDDDDEEEEWLNDDDEDEYYDDDYYDDPVSQSFMLSGCGANFLSLILLLPLFSVVFV